jgi:hypothetical protein
MIKRLSHAFQASLDCYAIQQILVFQHFARFLMVKLHIFVDKELNSDYITLTVWF